VILVPREQRDEPFRRPKVLPADLANAIKIIQAPSRHVVYGVGIGKKEAEKLAALKRKATSSRSSR